MKKITNLFVVLSILAATVFMTGCGLKEAIDSTHNTWYKYNKAEGVDIPLGSDTTEEDSTLNSLKGAEFYLYFDDDEGLLVAIQSVKQENVELYKGALSTTVDVVVGGTKQYTKEEFGAIKWGALVASGKVVKSEKPKIVAHPEQCFIITDAVENGIQWKRVLANILLSGLLEE